MPFLCPPCSVNRILFLLVLALVFSFPPSPSIPPILALLLIGALFPVPSPLLPWARRNISTLYSQPPALILPPRASIVQSPNHLSLVTLGSFPLSPTRLPCFHFSVLFSIQETFGSLGKQIGFSSHSSPNTFFLWCLSLSPHHYVLAGCGLHPMPLSVFPVCSPSGGLSLAGFRAAVREKLGCPGLRD